MFEIITIDELLRRLNKYNHKELHVHHTWKPNHKDFNGSNGIALQQGMRNYHVNTLKWNDIGQHVTLLPDGTFVTGRDFSKNPASISGKNTGAFACEMLGNFDTGNDKLEGKQKNSILRLAKYFDDKGRYVRFHRENSPKTCPGTSIDKGQFMNEVKNYGKQSSSIQNKGNIEVGTKVKVIGNKYATGQNIPDWVKKNTYTVTRINENRALLSDIVSWVYISDLIIEKASTVPNQTTKTGTVTASVLNVRKGAGTNYPVIGKLKKGQSIKLGVKVGDWWNIYYGDHGGFVSADYIKLN